MVRSIIIFCAFASALLAGINNPSSSSSSTTGVSTNYVDGATNAIGQRVTVIEAKTNTWNSALATNGNGGGLSGVLKPADTNSFLSAVPGNYLTTNGNGAALTGVLHASDTNGFTTSTGFSFVTNLVGPFIQTGATAETNVCSVSIPAGAIGSNGYLFISGLVERRNGTATATVRVRIGGGGATGAQVAEQQTSTGATATFHLAKDFYAINSDTNLFGGNTSQSYGLATSAAPFFGTNSTLAALPIYFNLAAGTNAIETNILWSAHIHTIKQN